MPVIGDEISKRLDQFKAKSPRGATLAPLSTVNERVALDIARYRGHLRAITDIESGIRDGIQKLNELDQQRNQIVAHVNGLRDSAIMFTAEAREQVGVLINKHGLTQEEVNALAPVSESIAAIQLDALVPQRMRTSSAANGAATSKDAAEDNSGSNTASSG